MPLIVNCILVGNGCLSVLLDSLLDCVMCVRSAMMLALRQRSRPAAPALFRRPARLIFAATGIGGFTYYSSAECTHSAGTEPSAHWSKVRPGESFTFTIEFDASYTTRIVTANAKRCLDGSAMSDTPGWEWKPKTSSVDSLHHAKLSASKAGRVLGNWENTL